MDKKKVIAIDLGASSGRVISVAMEDGKLEFEDSSFQITLACVKLA